MNAVRNIWSKYKDWLGDKVWYKNWKVWLSVVIIAFAGMAGDGEDEAVEAEEPTVEEVVQAEEEPAETEVAEEEPEELEEIEEEAEEVEVELSAQDVITSAVKRILGKKLIEIEYMEATDHYNVYSETSGLSANMDRKSTYFDTSNILEEIQNEEFGSLYFEYQAEFVDDFGDSETRKGITYDLTKETVDKIKFDNFLPDKLPGIADSYWQHPAFD